MRIIRIASAIVKNFLSQRNNMRYLKDPKLFSALELLQNIPPTVKDNISLDAHKKGLPSGWTNGTIFDECIGLISYLGDKINADPSIKTVLGGLGLVAENIRSFNAPSLPSGYTDTDLMNDITTIYSMGQKHRTTKTIQYPMFKGLYEKFQKMIGDAADLSGNPNLKSAVQSQNGLLQFEGVNSAIVSRKKGMLPQISTQEGLAKPQGWMYSTAKDIIDDIMEKRYKMPELLEQNFEIIKQELFSFVGGMDMSEKKDVEKQRREEIEKRKNVGELDPSYVPPSTPQKPVEEMYKTPTNQQVFVNPLFLTSIIVFFNIYYEELKKLEK